MPTFRSEENRSSANRTIVAINDIVVDHLFCCRESFPRGVPVLFIPGNGGSYKQVRSFGSITLRMGEESHSSKHLNFFTINFNEELSGLFGPMLQQQTEFLYECIVAIKNLYQRELRKDVHLILIGHSIVSITPTKNSDLNS